MDTTESGSSQNLKQISESEKAAELLKNISQNKSNEYVSVYIQKWIELFNAFVEQAIPDQREYKKNMEPKLIAYVAFYYELLSNCTDANANGYRKQFQKSINELFYKLDSRGFLKTDEALSSTTKRICPLPDLTTFAQQCYYGYIDNKEAMLAFDYILSNCCPEISSELMRHIRTPFCELQIKENIDFQRAGCTPSDITRSIYSYAKEMQKYFSRYSLLWKKEKENYFVVPIRKDQEDIGVKYALWSPVDQTAVSFRYEKNKILKAPGILLGLDIDVDNNMAKVELGFAITDIRGYGYVYESVSDETEGLAFEIKKAFFNGTLPNKEKARIFIPIPEEEKIENILEWKDKDPLVRLNTLLSLLGLKVDEQGKVIREETVEENNIEYKYKAPQLSGKLNKQLDKEYDPDNAQNKRKRQLEELQSFLESEQNTNTYKNFRKFINIGRNLLGEQKITFTAHGSHSNMHTSKGNITVVKPHGKKKRKNAKISKKQFQSCANTLGVNIENKKS
ncbi:hypothetical protein [Candidatus Cardinium hertigii]|uniref:Uncharacterized protein n=1 Tax=Candidatus Cardinium hertigii TaxID=247481 RepID=A0A3N2QCV1_9BACT|nr:hypothetical protein [Candidatus Cardinium hertigii]ROT47634.1 hypothetical protein EDM02_01145 [Candidatus Cardinium hertigii]